MWYFHIFCIFINNMLREDMLDKKCAKKPSEKGWQQMFYYS